MGTVAFVDDLIDRSKLSGAVPDLTFGRQPGDAAGADVVALDLSRYAEAVAAVRRHAPDARIVAFGRHTEADALRRAVADGADEALPRSRFFADIGAALRSNG